MDFAASVRRNINKSLQKVDVKATNITKQLFLKVVSLTPSPSNGAPYAKGYLANQWYVDYNDFSEELGPNKSNNGSDSITRINSIKYNMFINNRSITLTNNVSYAHQAEVLGWVKTGPYRMVMRAIQYTKSKYG